MSYQVLRIEYIYHLLLRILSSSFDTERTRLDRLSCQYPVFEGLGQMTNVRKDFVFLDLHSLQSLSAVPRI